MIPLSLLILIPNSPLYPVLKISHAITKNCAVGWGTIRKLARFLLTPTTSLFPVTYRNFPMHYLIITTPIFIDRWSCPLIWSMSMKCEPSSSDAFKKDRQTMWQKQCVRLFNDHSSAAPSAQKPTNKRSRCPRLLNLEIYHRHDKSLTADDHEPVQSNLHLYNQYFLDIICCYGSKHVRCFQSNLLKYSHPVGFVHSVFFPPGKCTARSFPALGVDGRATLKWIIKK